MIEVNEFKEGVNLDGYIENMPDDYYHNTKGFISKSSLSALKDSPFKFFSGSKIKQTRAMEMGTAIHCLVLEPEKFESEFKLMPELTDKRKADYKAVAKECDTSKLFIGEEAKNIDGMQKAIMNNSAARELLELGGWSEVSGFHTDPDSGVKLRHRFDRITKCGVAIDVKKTQSVNEAELQKTISKYGYHMQDALYSDAYEAIAGRPLQQFYFIFVEEKYPHEVAVVYLDDISKQVGREEYKALLMDYCFYLDNPNQLKNDKEINMISLPEWKLREFENELEDGGIF